MKSSISMSLLLFYVCVLHLSRAGRLEQLLRMQVYEDEQPISDISVENTEVNQDSDLSCVDCGPKKECHCDCHSCYCSHTLERPLKVEVDIMLADEEPKPCCKPELSVEYHIGNKTFSRDVTIGRRWTEDKQCFEVEGEDFCFQFDARFRRRKIKGKVRLTKPKSLLIGKFDLPL